MFYLLKIFFSVEFLGHKGGEGWGWSGSLAELTCRGKKGSPAQECRRAGQASCLPQRLDGHQAGSTDQRCHRQCMVMSVNIWQ